MIYKINEACRRARKVDYRRPPTVTRLGAAGGMQGEALSCTVVTGEQGPVGGTVLSSCSD